MKYRTDFVTNSSSSSFLSVTLNFTDSNVEEIIVEEDPGWHVDNSGWKGHFSNSEDGGLTFLEYPIETITELFACLYFYKSADEYLEVSTVPIFVSLFQFITEEIGFDTMMERIQTYIQDNEDSLDWDSIDGLSDLPDISPEEYDDTDQLIEAVKELFYCGEDEIIWKFYSISKNYTKISEIDSLVFFEERKNWHEGLWGFDDYCPLHVVDFPQRDKNDPLFEKEIKKWTDVINDIIKDYVSSNSIPGKTEIESFCETDDIKNALSSALESGNADGLFREIAFSDIGIWIRININSRKHQNEICISEKENDKENDDSVNSEHDSYFRLNSITNTIYYYGGDPTWNLEEAQGFAIDLREIAESNNFPKCFRTYPATGLLDGIILYVWKNFPLKTEYKEIVNTVCNVSRDTLLSQYETNKNPDMDVQFDESVFMNYIEALYGFLIVLPKAGHELDFADVGHYIYTDSLEILYPLFDRGLKIDPSAYDDLIAYSTEHGKPEYTAWLLERKNKDAQSKSTIE